MPNGDDSLNSVNPAFEWLILAGVYVVLVGLVYWIAKRISSGFLGTQDPEFLFVAAVLIAATLYALLSD